MNWFRCRPHPVWVPITVIRWPTRASPVRPVHRRYRKRNRRFRSSSASTIASGMTKTSSESIRWTFPTRIQQQVEVEEEVEINSLLPRWVAVNSCRIRRNRCFIPHRTPPLFLWAGSASPLSPSRPPAKVSLFITRAIFFFFWLNFDKKSIFCQNCAFLRSKFQ